MEASLSGDSVGTAAVDAVNNSVTRVAEDVAQSIESVPRRRTRIKAFLLHVWRSFLAAAKEQLEALSRGIYAALIAILVAVITPVMMQSAVSDKIESLDSRLQASMPGEDERLQQQRLAELIETRLQQAVNPVAAVTPIVHSEPDTAATAQWADRLLELEASVAQLQVENPANSAQTLTEQYAGMIQTIQRLQSDIELLQQHEQRLEQRLGEAISSDGVDNRLFLQNIRHLQKQGVGLQTKLQQGKSVDDHLNRWLRTVYYVVSSLPLEGKQEGSGMPLIQSSMQSVVNGRGNYRQPQQQVSEALVILGSVSVLGESGLIH